MIKRIFQDLDECILHTMVNNVLEKLQKNGMTYEEALEYYEYNQLGAYVGERTPAFLIRDYEL